MRAALATTLFPDRPDDPERQPGFANVAFFDAYFSNLIEGTEFDVAEAEDVVFRGAIPSARPEDAHDVLGTYAVVGSLDEMRRVPRTFDDLLAILRRRHARILEARPDKRPGQLEEAANRAGSAVFVAPGLVRGTLREGFAFYQSLADPFARALFLMFLVAEVHPFDDGNGRTARAMMNAELVAARQARILVPSVFRDEYLGALRRLSHHADPAAFLRTLAHGQELVARLDFADLAAARHALAECHAFDKPGADAKLRMPPPR